MAILGIPIQEREGDKDENDVPKKVYKMQYQRFGLLPSSQTSHNRTTLRFFADWGSPASKYPV